MRLDDVDAPGRVGIKPVILLTAGLWLTVFFYFTVRSVLVQTFAWDQSAARALNCLIGAGLCAVLYLVLRQQAHRPFVMLLTGGLAASLGVSVLFSAASAGVYELLRTEPLMPLRTRPDFTDTFIQLSQAAPWFFLAWVCGYFALEYNERLRANELRLIEARALAADAQNRMLRYQIQPHFLFNTLSAISTLILKDEKDRAERMVLLLSQFMRYSLVKSSEDRVTLAEEVQAQAQYLAIEEERFGDRLRFVKSVDPSVEGMLVPSLILQPLVENSVKYAVAPSDRQVTLEISARRYGDYLQIEVRDDGSVIPGPESRGLGVGLENVRRRLESLYAGRAEFRAGPYALGGFSALIRLPVESV